MKKIQISKLQFFAILYSYILANDIIRGYYAFELKQDVWIPMAISILGAIIIFYIYSFIYKNNNYKDFSSAIESTVGKYISKVIFIIYPIYFILLLFFNLQDIAEAIQIYFIDDANIFFLGLGILVVLFYIGFHGFEPFARYSSFILFTTLIFFVTFSSLLFAFNDFSFKEFLPILENGITPIIQPSMQMTYSIPMGELFVMIIIYQYVKEKKKSFRAGYLGIIAAGLILLSITVLNIIFLGPEAMTFGMNPSMRLWRRVDAENIIQRFDLIVLNIIILHVIVKLAVYVFVSKMLLNKIVKIKKEQYLTLIICVMIAFGFLFIGTKYPLILEFRKKFFIPYVNFVFEILIPFLLVFLSFIKRIKFSVKPPINEEKIV